MILASAALIGLLFYVGVLYLLWRVCRRMWRWFRSPTTPTVSSREVERMRREQQMRQALQKVLKQLKWSPDFRRAAHIAGKCKGLPMQIRQRLFVQYRPAMIHHVARCARNRVSSDQIAKQMRSLATALGMGAFEGNYVAHAGLADQRKAFYLLQLALEQMPRSPDFQRVVSFAAACEQLPVANRQQLFHQHRAEMARHFLRCRRRGLAQEELLRQLRQLVTSLATASFEADYIAQYVAKRTSPVTPTTRPGFTDQLASLRQEHQQRIAALRTQIDDEDMREQLIEEAEADFREQLSRLNRTGEPSGPTNPGALP